MSKFVRAGFSIFVLVFVLRDLKLGAVPAVSPSPKFFPISVKLIVYTVSQKKGATLIITITLPILDRFAKFFH